MRGINNKVLVGAVLKKEEDMFNLSVKPIGLLYKHFVGSYGKRNRGLDVATELNGYLFEGVLPQLEEVTAMSLDLIPASQDELENLKKIREIGEECKKIIENSSERGYLYPEDVSKLLVLFTCIRSYLDYRCGLLYLRRQLSGEDAKEKLKRLLRHHKDMIDRYIERPKFYLHDIYAHGFLVLFAVDAHNNQYYDTLLMRLARGEGGLYTFIPKNGLDRTIFNEEKRGRMIEHTRDVLRRRMEREEACLPSLQRRWFEREKIKEYRDKLFLLSNINTTPYIV